MRSERSSLLGRPCAQLLRVRRVSAPAPDTSRSRGDGGHRSTRPRSDAPADAPTRRRERARGRPHADAAQLSEQSRWDFADLRALYINCTLKRSPEVSNTQALADRSMEIMRANGVSVQSIRAIDLRHRHGRSAGHDRTRLGASTAGRRSSAGHGGGHPRAVLPDLAGREIIGATQVIERLYGNSHLLNDDGQYAYYGRTGGCLITGNEDGAKHCAMNILYSLQHLGYTIPPQADAAWLGEVGPGPAIWTWTRAARRTTSPTATPPS